MRSLVAFRRRHALRSDISKPCLANGTACAGWTCSCLVSRRWNCHGNLPSHQSSYTQEVRARRASLSVTICDQLQDPDCGDQCFPPRAHRRFLGAWWLGSNTIVSGSRFAASSDVPVIVNCTGLGAKALFDDPELMPVKGQLTVLHPQPAVTYAYLEPILDLYMFSRSDGIILGGSHGDGVWSRK